MVLIVVSRATLGVFGTFPSYAFTNTLSHGSNKGGQTLTCVLCLGIQMFWGGSEANVNLILMISFSISLPTVFTSEQ